MSIGPLGGINVSAAGAPLAQNKGSEVERSGQEIGAQERHVQNEQKAEAAAGIGETDGKDHQTGERDADGRLPWKRRLVIKNDAAAEPPAASPPPSRDTKGESGNLLDLSG
jgi:hypothetical protein